MACDLCDEAGGEVLWRDDRCRVVLVRGAEQTGYCRVVLHRHVAEMTDLTADERQDLMRVVFGVEAALRRLLHCDKINLASLGNQTPHLHWHIVPRWRGDRHWPQSIWGEPQPGGKARPEVAGVATAIGDALAAELR